MSRVDRREPSLKAAVSRESPGKKGQAAEALTWVHDLLIAWADAIGGGFKGAYYTETSFLSDLTGRSYEGFADDVMLIERAVARAKLENRRHWRVIMRKYLRHMPDEAIASDLYTTRDRVRAYLWAAQSCVGRHYCDLERGCKPESMLIR